MAVDFCNRLSEQEDLTPVYTFDNAYDNWSTYGETVTDFSADGYRLPTSSEWQWAAMGAIYGSTYTEGIDTTGWNKSFAGYQDETTIIGDYAVYGYASNYAYDDATPYERTNPVGSKQPNELGLYDMSGNVEEWCHDVFAVYPDGILTDYAGPGPEPAEDYPAMTQQGGSWYDVPIGCTIHNRNHDLTYWPMFFSEGRIGFRVVRR
jgi:formylglycine-generating enzyme required for sulfatase activity